MSSWSDLKPLQLLGAKGPAPNPWKVAIVLEELGLPWEFVSIGDDFFKTVKSNPFLKFNPNGRVPAFVDPNKSNVIIWESGAIIEYLIEHYDPLNKLSAPSSDIQRRNQERALLHFQASGQGPYFGQAVWFAYYHPTKYPDAVDRYINEAARVTSVLDDILKSGGGPWLTGEKLSYADLAFAPWFTAFKTRYDTEDGKGPRPGFRKEVEEKYPAWADWWKRLQEVGSVKEVFDMIAKEDWTRFGNKQIEELAKEIGI